MSLQTCYLITTPKKNLCGFLQSHAQSHPEWGAGFSPPSVATEMRLIASTGAVLFYSNIHILTKVVSSVSRAECWKLTAEVNQ